MLHSALDIYAHPFNDRYFKTRDYKNVSETRRQGLQVDTPTFLPFGFDFACGKPIIPIDESQTISEIRLESNRCIFGIDNHAIRIARETALAVLEEAEDDNDIKSANDIPHLPHDNIRAPPIPWSSSHYYPHHPPLAIDPPKSYYSSNPVGINDDPYSLDQGLNEGSYGTPFSQKMISDSSHPAPSQRNRHPHQAVTVPNTPSYHDADSFNLTELLPSQVQAANACAASPCVSKEHRGRSAKRPKNTHGGPSDRRTQSAPDADTSRTELPGVESANIRAVLAALNFVGPKEADFVQK